MEYKRFGQKILLRLNPGEEVAECIREVCRTEKVALGEVSGLGLLLRRNLGYLIQRRRNIMGSPSRASMRLPPSQAA